MTQVIQKVARMLSDKIEVKKRDRGNAGRKEIGTDGYEYHAGRYHLLSETDFAGIFGCTLWESFRNLCHDSLHGDLWLVLLVGCEDCRHRSVGEDNVDTYFDIYGDPWGVSGRKNGAAASGSRKSGRKETVYTDSAYRKYHRYAPDISKWRR